VLYLDCRPFMVTIIPAIDKGTCILPCFLSIIWRGPLKCFVWPPMFFWWFGVFRWTYSYTLQLYQIPMVYILLVDYWLLTKWGYSFAGLHVCGWIMSYSFAGFFVLLNYGLLISWFVCVLLDNELLISWFVCALLDELHICWCVCVLLDYELLICWCVCVLLDYELLICWFVVLLDYELLI
jgi:hypothetical protein